MHFFHGLRKFTGHGGKVTLKAEFTAGSRGDSGELFFAVSDTGVGISPEDQAKLMEPFVQLSTLRGPNAEHNGTGLGLSICKRLINKMNGRIQIASEVGKGSTFSVRLPDVAIAGRTAAPAQSAAPDNRPPIPPGTSVLIVDDVEMNIRVMCAMCRKAGITDIGTAASGEAALNELKLRHFDLMLTDMWMPNMNGAELAAAIQAMPQYAGIRLIAVTADIEAGGHFGMDVFAAVLNKPVTPEKLQAAIAAAIGAPPAAQRRMPEKNDSGN
ncbi:MAG: ATP-binding protein [Victivallaceae bacterium]|nr:ATP-binding protein [Victivallaceae bacterium]